MGSDFVREARKRARLTQQQLADLAGTTQSAIARIEAGRTRPAFDTVLRLVRLCGMDLDIMLGERDESDWIQASRLLELPEEERFANRVRFAQRTQRLREEVMSGA